MRLKELLNYPKNIKVFVVSTLLSSFIFYVPFLAVYLSQQGISTSLIAILFAVSLAVTVVLEIPTGIFADKYGNKKARILGLIITSIALIWLYFASSLMSFFIVFILMGIGNPFFSGTLSNMIYESLRAEKKQKEFKKVFGFIQAIWPLGAAVSFLIGGLLVNYSIRWTILGTIIAYLLALIVEFFFLDELIVSKRKQSHALHFANSFKKIWNQKTLIWLFIGATMVMAFSESAHTLKPLFFEFKQIPIANNGWIFALVSVISSVGCYYSHSVAKKIGNKTSLIASLITSSIIMGITTILGGITSALVLSLASFSYGIRGPIIDDIINRRTTKKYRTTIHSIFNLMQALGMAIVAPLLGYWADLWSINVAYAITAGAILLGIPFFALMKK